MPSLRANRLLLEVPGVPGPVREASNTDREPGYRCTVNSARLLPSRLVALAVACAVSFGAAASPAEAKTCSDYATQAEAQQAGDTRDGDGDGVYCVISPH